MKVFVNTDVIIDFLTGREPYGINPKTIFQLGKEEKLNLYTSPVVLVNANYIIGTLENEKTALYKITRFCSLVKVCSIGQTVVDNAIRSRFNDF